MATSKLQREVGNLLDKELPEYRILENYRPDWLISSDCTRLELDYFIQELGIAIEIQGEQHYQYVPFFHKSKNQFYKALRLDKEKRDLCMAVSIKFFEVITITDAIIIIKDIQDKHREKPKYFYFSEEVQLNHAKRKTTKIAEEERLRRASERLHSFEIGIINASEEKVSFWKRVVENNGKELDLV